jgi:hypothetical protein
VHPIHIIMKVLRCRKLSKRVSRLIALALNLEETYFEKPGITDDPKATLRLLHYSGQSHFSVGEGQSSHFDLVIGATMVEYHLFLKGVERFVDFFRGHTPFILLRILRQSRYITNHSYRGTWGVQRRNQILNWESMEPVLIRIMA